MQIVPAIIEKDITAIEQKLKLIYEKYNLVQIDICDGIYVKSTTYASNADTQSINNLKNLKNKYKFDFELDMMVNMSDRKWINAIKTIYPSKIAFHITSTNNWQYIFTQLSVLNIKIGLAIHLDSTQKSIEKLLIKYPFSYIQIMGIEKIGYGGQKMSTKIYDKIDFIKNTFPKLPISVDGGVAIVNKDTLISYGVSTLVAGSMVFNNL